MFLLTRARVYAKIYYDIIIRRFDVMNSVIEKPANILASPREFKDSFALYDPSSPLPYAWRTPKGEPSPIGKIEPSVIIAETNGVIVSTKDKLVFFNFESGCRHTAVISSESKETAERTADAALDFLNSKEAEYPCVRSATQSYTTVCGIVSRIAEYCGCLTDIKLPEKEAPLFTISARENYKNRPAVLLALSAICLIYRRMSALRGFNFKLVYEEGFTCLAFSANIIVTDISEVSDIPGYRGLSDLDSRGSITLYSRMSEATLPDCEGLCRLTVVISAQTEDPSGFLRAPDWKEQTRKKLDLLDFDVPGRF